MKKGKKVAYIQFSIILMVIVLAATNPSVDEHKAAVNSAFKEEAIEAPEAILYGALNKVMEGIGVSLVQYNNYGVCSLLKYKGKTMSFGIVGNVWFLGTISDVNDELFGKQAQETQQDEIPNRKPKSNSAAPDGLQNESDNLIGNLFNLGQEVIKAADEVGQEILALTLSEENKIGNEVHQAIRKEGKIIKSTETKSRLEKLAKPLIAKTKRKGIRYTFTILEDEEINAFSHLGGYIYVNKGLLDDVNTDSELQFVLGHEIAHVDLKHCVENVTYSARASELTNDENAGQLIQIAYKLISLGYSEEQEYEADAWAFRKMLASGASRSEASLWTKRQAEEDGDSESKTRPQTLVDDLVVEVENHFSSHPPSRERYERLRNLR
jgi:Zn-dependent protease with chaperone function